jgi:hypothetical protein
LAVHVLPGRSPHAAQQANEPVRPCNVATRVTPV